MKKIWKNNRIANILSEEEKALFKNDQIVSNDLINRKLNILFDMLTDELIEDREVTREDKGIEAQDLGLTTDNMVGQFIVQQLLKNVEMEELINVIGQGVVQLLLKEGAI